MTSPPYVIVQLIAQAIEFSTGGDANVRENNRAPLGTVSIVIVRVLFHCSTTLCLYMYMCVLVGLMNSSHLHIDIGDACVYVCTDLDMTI